MNYSRNNDVIDWWESAGWMQNLFVHLPHLDLVSLMVDDVTWTKTINTSTFLANSRSTKETYSPRQFCSPSTPERIGKYWGKCLKPTEIPAAECRLPVLEGMERTPALHSMPAVICIVKSAGSWGLCKGIGTYDRGLLWYRYGFRIHITGVLKKLKDACLHISQLVTSSSIVGSQPFAQNIPDRSPEVLRRRGCHRTLLQKFLSQCLSQLTLRSLYCTLRWRCSTPYEGFGCHVEAGSAGAVFLGHTGTAGHTACNSRIGALKEKQIQSSAMPCYWQSYVTF